MNRRSFLAQGSALAVAAALPCSVMRVLRPVNENTPVFMGAWCSPVGGGKARVDLSFSTGMHKRLSVIVPNLMCGDICELTWLTYQRVQPAIVVSKLSRWIPVTERLPPRTRSVYVIVHSIVKGTRVRYGRLIDTGNGNPRVGFIEASSQWLKFGVTHWVDLQAISPQGQPDPLSTRTLPS